MDQSDAYLAKDIDDSSWRHLAFGADREKNVIVVSAVAVVGPVKKGKLPDLDSEIGYQEAFVLPLIMTAGAKVNLIYDSADEATSARNRILVKIENAKG